MSGKIIKRTLAVFLSVLTVMCSFTTVADKAEENNGEVIYGKSNIATAPNYREYIEANGKTNAARTDAVLELSDGAISLKHADTVNARVYISESGEYELAVKYRALSASDIVLKVLVDGSVYFSECERLSFPCYWVNENNDWLDSKETQFTPKQIPYTDSVVSYARDYSGANELNYRWRLEAGEHFVSVTVVSGNFELEGISFTAPLSAEKYDKSTKPQALSCKPIVIEGESATLKNDKALIPLSDASSPLVHPSDAIIQKLNYIGGSNWSDAGQTVYWDFETEKDGYYSIGFQYRQNQILGGNAYRNLMIDGKNPFSESARVKFPYCSSWEYMTYSDGNIPYYIYLEKGKHVLSLSVTAGELCDLYSALQTVTVFMGDMYVDITKVVGETVDIYRSYELFNQIPNFNENLQKVVKGLKIIARDMRRLQDDKTGSSVSIIEDAARIVQKMLDNPYSAHKYKSKFYDSYTNLSAMLTDMASMPLDIDRIVISGYKSDSDYNSKDVSFGEKLRFGIKRFLVTFSDDYNTISLSGSKEDALTIWVNWGRDQAEALNSLIQDDFVSKHKIPVNMSLVNASLINAILAGSGPDCLLQMSRTEPVNLAMRGALRDLTEFEDYEEITERFHESAMLPYEYNGGVYALPLTQGFFMMFVRTDILSDLGIKIPDTWDEFIDATAVLQRNNLQAVIPYTQLSDSGTVNAGVGGLSLYPTLLAQRGLSLYNEKQDATALAETAQIQVFTQWTDLYTKYKFQEITNFYNRFRLGSAPIGIAGYSLYTELKAAAPEIDGRWTVTMIPGTKAEDGTLNRSSAAWGAGCAITNLSKNPDNAWTFLKWWTDADVQLKYSDMLESVLGPLGRVTTANVEAFSRMDWDMEMYEQMVAQLGQLVEIAEIPGGYYTARGIDQAFWNVTEAGKDPADMIKKWSAVVDGEIKRKKAQYEG